MESDIQLGKLKPTLSQRTNIRLSKSWPNEITFGGVYIFHPFNHISNYQMQRKEKDKKLFSNQP